ncbi:MAG TPA: hypothetical protein P5115_17590 [Spirochaetota bacterium]|nr:hypothetical protein [Spirochaetota bacterium]
MRTGNGAHMKKRIAALMLAASTVWGCTTGAFRDESAPEDQYHPSGKDGIRAMVDTIADINRRSPDSYALDFTIDGAYGGKKNKMLGSMEFNRKQSAMHVSVVDYIFRSPVMTLLQEGDVIRVYYPVEKKMYVDNARTIDMANYGGVSIDFRMFHDLITGVIPLISGYSVKQGLVANNGKGSMLILENPNYYQTISFRGNDPDKILLINRKTRERIELYVKNPVGQGASRIYSSVMIVAQRVPLRLEITFRKIQLNAPVKVKTFKDMKLPGGLKIIQM